MAEVFRTNSTYTRNVPFYLLNLYLVFEYGRVHTLLGPLESLHLPFLTSLGLLFLLLVEGPVLNVKQTKWYLGLLILMAIHVPLATNNYWAFQATRTILTYFVIHLAITKYVVSYEMFRKMIFLWLMCGIFVCAQGLLHKGVIKGSAFFNDENDFSLAMNMFLGISYFRILENPKRNIWVLAVIGLFICGTLVSFSRGGFIGLCVMLILIWIKSRRKLLGILLGAAMVLFIFGIASPKYWERMRTITEVEGLEEYHGSSGARIYYWERAWDMFLDNPILGIGPENYAWRISEYEPIGKLKGTSGGGKAAHSLYFTLIAELGVVGCVCFGMMLFINYSTLRGIGKEFGGNKRTEFLYGRMGRREEDTSQPTGADVSEIGNMIYYDALGLYASLAGFLACGAFLSVLYYPHFWILTSMITSLGRLKEEMEHKEMPSDEEGLGVLRERRFGLTG